MAFPTLLVLNSEAEYRAHFERTYCTQPLKTFDGIEVRFRKAQFGHCFFESVQTTDDTFSIKRAERMDWIRDALTDPTVELRMGWDNKRKQVTQSRRVAVLGNFVVVIQLYDNGQRAALVTAFPAGARSLAKIRSCPRWK